MSLNGEQELSKMFGSNTGSNNGISNFTIQFNKEINNGISIINYDPKNCGMGVYKDAIVAVLSAKRQTSLNSEWIVLDCNGLNKRFQLKWFDRGTEDNFQRFAGKLITCDIKTDMYGKTAQTEPVVIEQTTAQNDQSADALQYVREVSELYSNIKNFTAACNYFELMSGQKASIEVIKLALKIKYAKELCNNFPTSNESIIISSFYLRSMECLVDSPDFDPDFVIYANIYKQVWKGEEIAKYFVRSSTHTDINTHIINTVETLVDNIITGSALI